MPGSHLSNPMAALPALLRPRRGFLAGIAAAAALGVAVLGLAPPASAAPGDGSVPVWGVTDWGTNAVAENGVLTVGPIHLNMSDGGHSLRFSVHLELGNPANYQQFQFVNNGEDACRQSSNGTPGSALDCEYLLPVDAHGDATLQARRLAITPITAASMATTGGGSVKIVITPEGWATAVGYEQVVLHRHVHMTASIPTSLSGHVGDVVDVPWTITNTGPDDLPAYRARFRLTAPSGTEWTGPAAARCDPPVVPKSIYECRTDTALEPGHSITETWQLKIVSGAVGTGHLTARLEDNAGLPPDQMITDPAGGQGNADAAITVKVLPGTPSAGAPSPTPVANRALPITGTRTLAVAGVGLAVLLLGVGLVVVQRRRRRTVFTSPS